VGYLYKKDKNLKTV